VLHQGLDDHPAVLAWRSVEPRGSLPRSIDVFSESPNWLLYALKEAGHAGSTVFAKRRLASMAATERAVYERILPRLPLATPHCYGCQADGEYVWFLLEAVEGAPYDESNPEHLAMASRFVAAMHTLTTPLAHSISIPEAGPERYLAHLVAGRERLSECLRTSRALVPAGRVILEQTVARLDGLEVSWPVIRARCADAPTTLVHGDFRPKNVFVRHDGTGLVAFDWETAGWGPPAPDLTKIDLAAYWRAVQKPWGAVSFETVAAWAGVGQLFQTLAAIDWKGTELAVDTTEELATPVGSLRLMGARLAELSALL
jgi:aminoglycoside phosphotransferase (APT) family kinase protein